MWVEQKLLNTLYCVRAETQTVQLNQPHSVMMFPWEKSRSHCCGLWWWCKFVFMWRWWVQINKYINEWMNNKINKGRKELGESGRPAKQVNWILLVTGSILFCCRFLYLPVVQCPPGLVLSCFFFLDVWNTLKWNWKKKAWSWPIVVWAWQVLRKTESRKNKKQRDQSKKKKKKSQESQQTLPLIWPTGKHKKIWRGWISGRGRISVQGGAGEGDEANDPITTSWQTKKKKNTQEVVSSSRQKWGTDHCCIGIVFCAFALKRFLCYMCYMRLLDAL